MSVGIRFPANLFRHPSDKRITAVNSELQYWTNHSNVPVTKVVYGHFRMSFTTSSEKGHRYESVFVRQSISAYLCGHLHAKLSKQLWGYHEMRTVAEENPSGFWEWELGDWKESRLMRILAIDRGVVSFIDHTLEQASDTYIMITYPIDSKSMNTMESKKWSLRNDINVLVFSDQVILNVSAKIVEEIPLLLCASSSAYKPLFHAKWNAENYRSLSATRYWLQVFVLESHGQKTSSERRPFSIEGNKEIPPCQWLTFLIFKVQWEDMYKILLWSNLAFTTILLFTPKLLYHFVKKSSSYQRWTLSVLTSPVQQRNACFWFVWLLMKGARSKPFWCALVIYVLWLIEMPWFWGHATSENGEIARMYLSGWSVPSLSLGLTNNKLSNPYMLVITLPFLYLVVVPAIFVVYGLFAEQAIAYLRHQRRTKNTVNPTNVIAKTARLLPSALVVPMNFDKNIKSLVIKFCGS